MEVYFIKNSGISPESGACTILLTWMKFFQITIRLSLTKILLPFKPIPFNFHDTSG